LVLIVGIIPQSGNSIIRAAIEVLTRMRCVSGIEGWTPEGAALVIAHPGHELRVHGWLEWARPTVFVLTDGSGHGSNGRLASSTRLIQRSGGRTGSVCGRFTDRELYDTILEGRMSVLTGLVTELADAFVAGHFEYVVADAAEGYNPGHDVCRYLVDAAVRTARPRLPATFKSFEMDLAAAPAASTADRSVHLDLDESALERKIGAAREYVEMAEEVDAALNQWGAAAFRHECLRETPLDGDDQEPAEIPPFYERHGERRQAEGTYDQVIRYREHIRPLRDALRLHAGTSRRCPA
jgi:hypothetical protein